MLSLLKPKPDTVTPTTLEDTLTALMVFGKPRLSLLDKGWYCTVDMHVQAVGASFNIASEFGKATPFDAASECLQRVRETLKGMGHG